MKASKQSSEKVAKGTSGAPLYEKHGKGDTYDQYSTKREAGK